ncbi:hypothetical protein A2936_04785 [Candidatus Uhrbacteria bacterium RIFCSPLOWO2_01_FULL_47_25]|uniref:Polymerase nucleotidyl transferase domain-containing protein n=1 Tax=Candidatus Uhrbacteria bacterium RIFCSPLOWO2_01_FULL_47_25 TaxID=1802402 RepID=A0A1F7UWF9_9BACT|nr:MAG: hypothetical protein UX68_C0003G0022 [Parcubacteria group bacterium GW2011_GWA2_46_9]OGL82621.1 MAG: hypothetical protein A2936_04785 [Candidatus Uhrbacteria bacterium RIFCSPLOWO2_01_FULL_47_25]
MLSNPSPLSSIVRTVAYFDLFDYPLTTFEVWKWLWREDGEGVSYGEVDRELEENPEIKKYIVQCSSFWCLKGRENIVATREERYRLAIAKLQRAWRIAHLFSYLPWIQGIAACNSLGYRNASAKSDIDFFIITRPGTIWLVRFLTVGFLAIFGLRPRTEKIADTICLSFFVASDAMNLEKLQKPDGDPYLVYWITQLTPLFGRGDIWQKFWEANAWIRKFIPNALPTSGRGTWLYDESLSTLAKVHDRELLSKYSLAAFMNKAVKRWQISRLPQRLRERATVESTDVVVSDQVLKFHDNDRRLEYRERWVAQQKHLGLV